MVAIPLQERARVVSEGGGGGEGFSETFCVRKCCTMVPLMGSLGSSRDRPVESVGGGASRLGLTWRL